MRDARHAVVLPLNQERRRHQRVKVMLTGRFMREDRQEFPCQTVNMSPGGVALTSEAPRPRRRPLHACRRQDVCDDDLRDLAPA
jgi:hypothetical protein